MKIKLIFDNVNYLTKPKTDIGSIINRMTIDLMKEYSIEEIKQNILDGKTNRPAYCGGKEYSWKSQQMFMIDIDDNFTIEQAINKCKEINIIPNFIYTSFSHTEDHHKFRLVFILDKEITNFDIAKRIQLYLINSIGNVDIVCKNLNRPYFAGKSIVFDSGNILESDYMIKLTKNIELNKIENSSKSKLNKSSEKKPHDNKDIRVIPILSCGEKPPVQINDNYYNIKALRNRDVKYLKDKIGNPRIILENNQAFFNYIKSYDLGALLEIKYPNTFRCIFHDDNNPSAGIFINDEGTYIYHCFGCGISYNIINVIEVLGNFQSRPKAYKFIRNIFNLEIMETEWQKEQKEIIRENHRTLLDGELEKHCPEAYKNIKRNIKYLDQLFLIAEDNVYSEKFTDENDNVIFYASTKFICNKLGMSENSATEVSKKNTLFVYHNLLNKLDDMNIPEDMLKRSQAITANNKDDNKKQKHINFYSIPSYNTNLFKDIEYQGKQWKENHYTMKGLSREMFYRAEGLEVANKLYPQYKEVVENVNGVNQIVDRTTTKASNIRTNNIVKVIHELIDEYGYATENAIVENLKLKYAYITTQVQIKKSLKEIFDIYDLKRIRANKEIKEQYAMDTLGYPFIIIKMIKYKNLI